MQGGRDTCPCVSTLLSASVPSTCPEGGRTARQAVLSTALRVWVWGRLVGVGASHSLGSLDKRKLWLFSLLALVPLPASSAISDSAGSSLGAMGRPRASLCVQVGN